MRLPCSGCYCGALRDLGWAGGKADDSVEAGRQYVAACADFMHHVENLHQAIKGAGGHQHAAATATPRQPTVPIIVNNIFINI